MTQMLQHNGCLLSYQVEGSGPPLVLIQGVGVHGSGWSPQVQGLSGDYQCLSFDNRGIGASQPASRTLSVAQMAADAAALMNHLQWESAHVAGHSLGGLIALQLALDAPKRVRSLSLLCTFSNGADATRLTPWMLWTGLRSRIGTRAQRRNAFLRLVLPPGDWESAARNGMASKLGQLFGHDIADQPPVTMSQMSAMRACDLTPRLNELAAIPTLVVSARHDPIARPAYGRAIAAGIPGAHFVELEQTSHGAPIQFASEMNHLLRTHLDQAEAAR